MNTILHTSFLFTLESFRFQLFTFNYLAVSKPDTSYRSISSRMSLNLNTGKYTNIFLPLKTSIMEILDVLFKIL